MWSANLNTNQHFVLRGALIYFLEVRALEKVRNQFPRVLFEWPPYSDTTFIWSIKLLFVIVTSFVMAPYRFTGHIISGLTYFTLLLKWIFDN